MADPVQLTDLDVIARYSIAVRRATADRSELIQTLRADLTWLQQGQRRTHQPMSDGGPDADREPATEPATEPDAPPAEADEQERARPPLRRMPVKVTPAKKAVTKTAAAKKTATAKQAGGRKSTASKQPAARKTTTKRSTKRR